ncbi:ubiquitin-protein ligase [Lithospermum erythrorhizon]|uniref:Ubiquitin-protein ligase n=1 Tax=Lithospermum erythrorhizon TaxID=34254 RepID=A0AAV3QZR3_LITER
MENFWIFVYGVFCLMASRASGNVLVIGNNATLSFEDIEANFAPSVKGSGICGLLYTAEPLNACKELSNIVEATEDVAKSPFALIIRGGCSFEDKVRRAQAAGFTAAIIHDNEYGDLVASNHLCPSFNDQLFILHV